MYLKNLFKTREKITVEVRITHETDEAIHIIHVGQGAWIPKSWILKRRNNRLTLYLDQWQRKFY